MERSDARRRVLDLDTPVVHDRGGRHGVCVRVCACVCRKKKKKRKKMKKREKEKDDKVEGRGGKERAAPANSWWPHERTQTWTHYKMTVGKETQSA